MSKRGRPRLYATQAEKMRAYRAKAKLRQRGYWRLSSLPPGPYRVLYADPPWQYRRTPFGPGQLTDRWQTLSLPALCAMAVQPIAAPQAVLFLWVPSPMLPAGFEVMRAWGFTYKASLVWERQTLHAGADRRPQHEFLLLCMRGACPPALQALPPSVQRLPPGPRAAKPAEFRQLIDTLYPEGPRLELFARQHAEEWDSWGRETDG
jgi:N6-adenosine-specific RNA methylase IME4